MRCPAALASIAAASFSVLPLLADEPPPAGDQQAPAESFIPEEILDTKVYSLGERSLILQEVVPPPLPPPPAPPDPSDPAVQVQLQAFRDRYAGAELIAVSATVYDHAHTLLRWSIQGQPGEEWRAWVNVDLNHLGNTTEVERGGRHFRLNLGLGNVDSARAAAASARKGVAYVPPAIPEFEGAAPTAIAVGGTVPPAAAMEPVEAILDLYRAQGQAMKLAYQEKLRIEAEQRAEREANPTPAPDVVLRYWRSGGKAVETSKSQD